MTNIFIANLDFDISSDDLKATFSQFGEVSYAHVVYDKNTKKSKGFGYVEMENGAEAKAAIQSLNGIEVNGRAIDVKMATPKKERKAKGIKQSSSPQNSQRKPRRPRNNQVKDAPLKPRRVLRPRRKRRNNDD